MLTSPAIGLLNRLGFKHKFLLCAFLLLVPSVILYIRNFLPQFALELLVLAGLGILVGMYFLAALYRATQYSIANLLTTVRAMTEGDLSARSSLDSGDEFGEVSVRLNEMARESGRLIKDVHAAAEEVASAASELAIAAARVVSGADAQNNLSSKSTQSMERLQSSVNQITEEARLSQTIAEESESLSERGVAVVQTAGGEMERIQDSMIKLTDLVSSMGQRSDEISGIVDVIRGIADQTNLLALNAAIEAARAGEHGRGFAVVADEVRKLAERTSLATGEISTMITGILEEITATIAGMEEGRQQAINGVTMAKQAAESLEAIRQGARSTMDRVRAIVQASQEQTRTSAEAMQSMADISAMAHENTAASDEAASVSKYLEGLASELRQSVLRFKI
jgi:methyl-accepting chemotaxis protein